MPDSTAWTAKTGDFPNSAGTGLPRSRTVPKACDTHFHVLDPRFATPETAQPAGATFDGYRANQARVRTTRRVIVRAKYHRTDPTCLLDALASLGPDGRDVAVVHPDVPDTELRRLDACGVRGLRFSVWYPADTVTTVAMIQPLARRSADCPCGPCSRSCPARS